MSEEQPDRAGKRFEAGAVLTVPRRRKAWVTSCSRLHRPSSARDTTAWSIRAPLTASRPVWTDSAPVSEDEAALTTVAPWARRTVNGTDSVANGGPEVICQWSESSRTENKVTTTGSDHTPATVTWIDAFPWLGRIDLSGDGDWTRDPLATVGRRERRNRIATISELASEHLPHHTLGQLFPLLARDLPLDLLELPTRARTAAARYRLATVGDIADETIDTLLGWRGIGAGSIDGMLQAIALTTVTTPTPRGPNSDEPPTVHAGDTLGSWPPDDTSESLPPTSFDRESVAPADVGSLPQRHDGALPSLEPGDAAPSAMALPGHREARMSQKLLDMLDAWQSVAEWHALVGSEDTPLAERPGVNDPEHVARARALLRAASARDLLGDDTSRFDVAVRFGWFFEGFDARERFIAAQRMFADTPVSLEHIGDHFGVSRERIRQIEASVRNRLEGFLDPGSDMGDFAATVREASQPIRSLADLLTAIPSLARDVEVVGQPLWRVMDRIDDGYEVTDGWCVAPTEAAASALTEAQLLEHTDQHGVTRMDEITCVVASTPERATEDTVAWLRRCGHRLLDEYVITRSGSVGDYAAAVLSIGGQPLSSSEILARFEIERNERSLRNALSQDDRFTRIDRDRWALAEWQLDAYGGIRQAISAALQDHDGQVDLEQLVEDLPQKFDVSPRSVIAYASSAPFETTGGVVRFTTRERITKKTPALTARLYRRPDAWVYRITVTKDHLRGSGSPAPLALAGLLGLKAGEARRLDSRLGPQHVAWRGQQPAFGTIRRFVIESDVEVGTPAFIVLGDDGTFDVEPIGQLPADPLERACVLAAVQGARGTDTHGREAIASALGLEPSTSLTEIASMCRRRGDEDIAQLIVTRVAAETDDPQIP